MVAIRPPSSPTVINHHHHITLSSTMLSSAMSVVSLITAQRSSLLSTTYPSVAIFASGTDGRLEKLLRVHPTEALHAVSCLRLALIFDAFFRWAHQLACITFVPSVFISQVLPEKDGSCTPCMYMPFHATAAARYA